MSERIRKFALYWIAFRTKIMMYLSLLMIIVNLYATFQLISVVSIEGLLYLFNLIIVVAYVRKIGMLRGKERKNKLKKSDVHKTALE